MSYILVNDGSETGDAETTLKSLKYTFTPESGYAITFSEGLNNVPVRRNWRTNILGKILTGDIEFNISIDPIYDGDIIYPSEQEQELEFAATFGGTVTLTEDVTLTEPLVVGADMILNIAEGKTLTGSINVAEGATLAVNGGAIQNGNSAVSGITSVGDLTLNDVTITSARHGVRIEGGNAVINGGNYSVSETAGMTHHALNVSGNSNVIIKGGTFAGPGKNTADDSGSAVKVQSGSTVTIEGGDFSGGKNSTLSSEGTLSISGGTFDQEPKADWIADGYKSIESNGTYYVVSNDVEGVSNEAELKSALEAAKKNILLLNNIALSEAITVSNDFSLKSNGLEITNNNGAVFAIADNANVTITIKDAAKFTGSTDGITVPKGETLTINGAGNLVVEGKAGSGIGYGVKGEEIGTININGLAHITAKGNGVHAFGIGGNGADVLIKNSTVDYACGGYIQPLFVSDTKYGKNEPEGGAAIGGETIKIEGSIITKAEGGSKAAAIGAQYHQSTKIEIINSTILEAIGGNASAGIGGSRYSSDISETNKQSVKIHIENSNVTANGGQAGAGIGSGYDTHCAANDVNAVNDIVIKNSTVTAKGGKYAAGIGTGYHAAALTGSIDAASTVNAASGEKFYKDTYSTAQDIGYGVVDPVREYAGATVTFTVNEKVIAAPWGDVKIGDNYYATLAAAAAAAKAGETITITSDVTLDESLTLPAGITLNGNGKQIDGTIYAGGDLTFVGHTKVTGFSATYYDRTITIGEGACLEVTGTGRTTLAYGNVFNVTGSVTNAKSDDKTTIQPSLIILAGISITDEHQERLCTDW